MEFADDIALGNFTPADIDNLVDEGDYSRQAKRAAKMFSGMQLSFAISAILHFVLASTLFYFVANDLEKIEEHVPKSIRVKFVPSNPLLIQVEEIIPETLSESVAPIPLAESYPALPMVESQPESSRTDVPEISESEIVETPPVENSYSNSQRQVETVTLPSVESVRRVLSNSLRSDASRFYTYDCNKLEEEKEFSGCAPSDTRDYSSLTRNPVYDFHNPAVEISRSSETVTTLARQSARISGQLASSNLPPGLYDYVLEELEQGIETYSNNSVRALDHMNTMVDKSAAGVMARRVFDNWVQQQSTLLQSRRVENRSDRQFRERCRSYEKFIMAPVEFVRCLSIGESLLGFSIEF
ncbi:MAG: hypothetical protein COB20_07135 [SAR86 cluster bacterium]|uniref:Uncharacterized protein n=1 Tax=SAR86 cluster bacterium TaxID=2030880 RepID=A0A2A4X6K9_9GAMM|nr:MAG: hypothetical protein COB20_07135 [SAR86 cluster bacterium]